MNSRESAVEPESTMNTRSLLKSWLLFISGTLSGIIAAVIWSIVCPADPPRPSWLPNEVIVQSLIDNLESENEDVRLYAVWRLGERTSDKRAALSALEKMDLRQDEGLGKERAMAIHKLGGRP
jgi:hypothetical protein